MNLFQAIRDNNLESLKKLLQESPDLNQQEPDGAEVPLTLAVSLQRVEALRLLLEAGADPSYVFPDLGMNLTILQAAASKPDPELVRVLIDAGADLNATNVMGSTALNEALDKGHLKAVDALLNAGTDVSAGTHGFQKIPALIQAIQLGYFDLVPRLLELGADVNQADSRGATSLMFALVADDEWRNQRPTEERDRRQREMVEKLLAAGADPNAALTQQAHLLNKGMTPLMITARSGRMDLVQRLLDAGADCLLLDAKKQSALDWAVKTGHREVVACLQEQGDSKSVDIEKLRVTSLMTAARKGNVRRLRKLIEEGVDLNAVDPDRSQWGRSALIHATMQKHFTAVELLLQAGADPNQREKLGNREDESPLHHAAAWKDSRFIKILLDSGADPDLMNKEQNSPLVNAAEQGNPETVELLLRAGASPVLPERETGEQPLWAALRTGHTEVAHLLLDAGHPLDGKVLVTAALRGQPSIVRRALEAGIDPDSKVIFEESDDDRCGLGSDRNLGENESDKELREPVNYRTPLIAVAEINAEIKESDPGFVEAVDDEFDGSCQEMDSSQWQKRVVQSQLEIIRMLLDAGADPNGQDDGGRTPLNALADLSNHVLVRFESGSLDPDDDTHVSLSGELDPVPAMELLLEAGADINTKDHLGRTTLHRLMDKTLSWHRDPLPIIRFLLEAGAEVDPQDNEGQTPLMLAMGAGSLELVRLLLNSGADVNAVDQKGQTVLMHAADNTRDPDFLIEVLNRGANINARNQRGETALSIAQWRESNVKFTNVLKNFGAENPLHKEIELRRAAKAGDRSRVQEMLEQGADVNHIHRGGTALQVALYEFGLAKGNPNEELVKDLLKAGADVALESASGYMSPPLLQVISTRKPELVRLFLEFGAEPSAKYFGNVTAAMHAAQCGDRAIVNMLLEAGAEEDELTRVFLAAYRWEEPARSSEFQTCVAELEEFTGMISQPIDQDKGRGVVTVVLRAEEEAQALRDTDPELSQYTAERIAYAKKVENIFEALQDRFLERGFYLCRIGAYAVVDRGRVLGLFPTDNPFEIMAFVNVNGNEVELRTDEVISWFQKFYQDHPFRLTACLADTVEITLLNPVLDTMKLARALYCFCPDMVEQGTETIGALAEQMRNSPRVYFWWD